MTSKEILEVTKTLNLLYVEDDVLARESTLDLLENYFQYITVAVDGQDGLDRYKENEFDLIISDINMPELSGIEMVKKIREVDSDIAILFLTAYNEPEFLSDGIYLGVDGYILKPLRLKKLLLVLSKICEKVNLQRSQLLYQTNLEEEVKKQTQELSHKLHYDELTNLYSRYSFFKDIENIKMPIVFIIDINRFKIINEIYGSHIGSKVLKKFASFLLNFTSDTTYKAYRIAGDEFLLLDVQEYIDTDKYEEDIEKFFTRMNDFSLVINDDIISIEVTLGISTSESDAFECAKIALDYAKSNNYKYTMYSRGIDSRSDAQNVMSWKEKIKSAIKNSEVVPVYQPIVDKNEKIIKYETLMRIRDEKTKELISPNHFLDIAIKAGLYQPLSTYVIFEALSLLEKTTHTFSLNFTYSDISNEIFLNELERFFKSSPQLGKHTVFEITENESIADYSVVKNFIKRFKAYNIEFAIDDFGSGFSNFEYILEIEPDYLKIDGTLVKSIDTDKKAFVLVEAIVVFSHKLGIKVIAEYVHSKKIFEILKKLNIDEFQGFYFSKPLECIENDINNIEVKRYE
ncbi:MAG: EAL domain-containing protein [Campylobacterota bacterium]|nr:EAL domain-containing protein [Campylobacterota bacterium]